MIRKVNEIPFSHLDIFLKNYFDTKDDFFSVGDKDNKINYPLDLMQSDDGLTLQIACVGAELNDIQITTSLDTLRIKYDKPKTDDNINYIIKSIAQRSFDLGYKVSGKYDLEKIEAKLSKGLLTIKIPYKESQQPKAIKIASE
jgi:HSP20 family protein